MPSRAALLPANGATGMQLGTNPGTAHACSGAVPLRPLHASTVLACLALLALAVDAVAVLQVGDPGEWFCDIENDYGRSMATLSDGSVVVGAAGEFCGFIDVRDATGATVHAVRDTEDFSFGSVVGGIGKHVLVGSWARRSVERLVPMTAEVVATYELPGNDGRPDAVVALGRKVVVLEASGVEPARLRVFDGRSGRLVRTLDTVTEGRRPWPVLARAGRRLVTGASDGTVRVLSAAAGRVLAMMTVAPPGEAFSGSIAADGHVIAVGAGGRVHLFDRRGRARGVVHAEPDAGCFGAAVAVLGDALLVGAPCTGVDGDEGGAAFLYSIRTGTLVARYDERSFFPSFRELGRTVVLLPGAVALAGRGPDTADNGFVRVLPR
jgi:hypothetical protein